MFENKKIYDISMPVNPNIPVYKGKDSKKPSSE
jgi:kynurenine formamidase